MQVFIKTEFSRGNDCNGPWYEDAEFLETVFQNWNMLLPDVPVLPVFGVFIAPDPINLGVLDAF